MSTLLELAANLFERLSLTASEGDSDAVNFLCSGVSFGMKLSKKAYEQAARQAPSRSFDGTF